MRLDLTADEATSEQGSLQLRGASSGYNKTIAIASNNIPNPAPDDTVDVHFEDVPTDDKRTLTHIAGDGSRAVIRPGRCVQQPERQLAASGEQPESDTQSTAVIGSY